MRYSFLIFALLITGCTSESPKAQSSKQHVGGRCEGCEAVYEYGNRTLNPIDTFPGFESGSPRMKLTGTVFEKDGKTPARDVIVYAYHTNREGRYAGGKGKWGQHHGQLRGWVKTNADGQYTFYSIRPASYPNSRIPAHIHLIVKEPDVNEYYIDAVEFTDDPYLTDGHRANQNNRGGSGIVTPIKEGDWWLAERDIILGENVPGYP